MNKSPRKKLLILLPNGNIHKLVIPPFLEISFREAPLTATMLAALVPTDLDFDITICDESVSRVPQDHYFDLVAISVITGTAYNGYRWADFFRKKGSTVVIGGVHATLLPEEAAKYADSIVIGFAEETFPELCRDFMAGSLKKTYHQIGSNLKNLPIPRRDLQKRFGYMMPNTIFATRGCKNNCEFCAVVGAKFGWQTRPIGEVIDEIRKMNVSRFAMNDVSLCEDREYALELFQALKPLKKKWGGLMTTKVTSDDELMDALAESGCCYMLLGFESVMQRSLYQINKNFNNAENYFQVCNALHGRKIVIQGCFIFGLDGETPDLFQDTIDAVNELRIDIPRYALFTPFPGTEAYQRMKSEQRLLHENWAFYDTQHVVIQPSGMTPEELDRGFRSAWEKTFSLSSVWHRTSVQRRMYPVSVVGNLAYQLYIRRLKHDQHRFPTEGNPYGA